MSLLPKDTDLDWKTIWNKQTMYPDLAKELIRLALVTQRYLTEQAGGGLVRTISRTHSVWDTYKKVPFELSSAFTSTLISKEETKATEAAAKRAHKFNLNIEASVEIFNLGADYWMKVYNELSKENILPYGDLDFIKSIATRFISKMVLPSAAQCKRLLKIVHNAEDKGYIMP